MQNILSAILVAFNFFPGYKTKAGAVVLLGVAAGTAWNVAAPTIGMPTIPGDYLVNATIAGNAILGVGVANKLAAK